VSHRRRPSSRELKANAMVGTLPGLVPAVVPAGRAPPPRPRPI